LTKLYQDGPLVSEYIYDDNNKLAELKTYYQDSLIRTETFTWNAQNRLAGRSYDDWVETFTYNSNGQISKFKKLYTKTGKTWEEEYHYDPQTGQIDKGVSYFDGQKNAILQYQYDSFGNAITRKEISTVEENLIITEYRLAFDNRLNPFPMSTPPDMAQVNNIKSYYYYNIVMSSMPPEYEAEFTYKSPGLPVKETRIYKYNPTPVMYEYVYITKKPTVYH